MTRMSNDEYLDRLIRRTGASTEKTGQRVTADPAAAACIRDPETGERHDRSSPIFRKWEKRLAAR